MREPTSQNGHVGTWFLTLANCFCPTQAKLRLEWVTAIGQVSPRHWIQCPPHKQKQLVWATRPSRWRYRRALEMRFAR
jgi:hypothetical protein